MGAPADMCEHMRSCALKRAREYLSSCTAEIRTMPVGEVRTRLNEVCRAFDALLEVEQCPCAESGE